MNRIKNIASKSPVTFGTLITLTFIVFMIISAVIANRWPAESQSWYIAATTARVISIVLLIGLAAGLGWLRTAGFTSPGRWYIWLLLFLLLGYGIIASSLALTGQLTSNIPGTALISYAGLFFMAHAFLEEVTFRGLVMPAFLNKWGDTSPGTLKSVVAASLFFAAMHLVNLLGGNPLPVVLLQAAGGFFLGLLLGGLVVNGRSIYPAVLLHGLLNIAAYLNLAQNSTAAANPGAWLIQSLLLIPPALIGIYLLYGASRRPMVLRAI